MDITFSDSFSGTLLATVGQPVLGLQLELQVGDLHRFDDPDNEFWQLKGRYVQNRSAADFFKETQRGITKIRTAIAQGEPLRVWRSSTADDQIGFWWLCEQLKNSLTPLSLVEVPLLRPVLNQGVHLVEVDHLGELSEGVVTPLLTRERPVDKLAQRAFTYRWQDLLHTNAPLRVNVSGHVMDVPLDFYDHLLRNLQRPGWSTERLVGEFIGRYPVGVPDWWLCSRAARLSR